MADLGGADIWISVALAGATIVMFFTLPVFGAISDRLRRKMPFLRVFTILAIISFGSGYCCRTNKHANVFIRNFNNRFVFLFQYFYQGSFAFYHSFLPDLAVSRSLEKFRVSAWRLVSSVMSLALQSRYHLPAVRFHFLI